VYLATPASLGELLEQMRSISAFQFDLDSLDVERDDLRSLSGQLKRVRKILSFKAKTLPGQVKDALLLAFSAGGISKPRASCVDSSGDQIVLDLDLTGLSLHTAKYDELAKDLEVSTRDFAQSAIVIDLLAIARRDDNAALLTTRETK
jgi:hypothetical protein